ncbi:MAG: hypothetical protein U9Q74_05100 [Gemmatimonadota bacterium]|nr:hypothetical protein [Gemmatimonadota bacterium]
MTTAGTATGTINVVNTQCNGTLNATWTASKAGGPEVALSGTWNGTFASSLVSRTSGTLVLSQNGANVTGTYTLPNGARGNLTGTVSGRTMTFTLSQTTVGCTGTFAGHGVLMPSPELLVYFYTGSDCLGSHTQGNGSASR